MKNLEPAEPDLITDIAPPAKASMAKSKLNRRTTILLRSLFKPKRYHWRGTWFRHRKRRSQASKAYKRERAPQRRCPGNRKRATWNILKTDMRPCVWRQQFSTRVPSTINPPVRTLVPVTEIEFTKRAVALTESPLQEAWVDRTDPHLTSKRTDRASPRATEPRDERLFHI